MMDPRLAYADIALDGFTTEHEIIPGSGRLTEAANSTVIATSSFYKPKKDGNWDPSVETRAKIAIDMFKAAQELTYGVVCVDENSDTGWLEEAKKTGARIVQPDFNHYSIGNSNVGRCRRQAIDLASQTDAKVVCWIEPEKLPFVKELGYKDNIKESPIAWAAVPLMEEEVDMVIPRRRDNGKSYPIVQQMMERAGNFLSSNLMFNYALLRGESPEGATKMSAYLDHFFGAKMFRTGAGLENYFTRYGELAQSDAGFNDVWGSVHYAPFMAIMDGKIVGGVPVNYTHPLEQRDSEARNIAFDMKRYDQGDKLAKTLSMLLNRDLKERGISEQIPL